MIASDSCLYSKLHSDVLFRFVNVHNRKSFRLPFRAGDIKSILKGERNNAAAISSDLSPGFSGRRH